MSAVRSSLFLRTIMMVVTLMMLPNIGAEIVNHLQSKNMVVSYKYNLLTILSHL